MNLSIDWRAVTTTIISYVGYTTVQVETQSVRVTLTQTVSLVMVLDHLMQLTPNLKDWCCGNRYSYTIQLRLLP